MWRRSKWLSLLLVFSITCLAIAPQVSLASTSTSQTNGSTLPNPKAYRNKGAKHVTEVTDKRDQHTKYYLNDDGSYTAEVAINSRHYKDAQGQWQDMFCF